MKATDSTCFLFVFHYKKVWCHKNIIQEENHKYLISVNTQSILCGNRYKILDLFSLLFSFPSFRFAFKPNSQKSSRKKHNQRRGRAPHQALQTTYERIEETSINCEFRRQQMLDYLTEKTKQPAGQEASSASDEISSKS